MRILQVISSMNPLGGGVSEAVRQLSEAAVALGCSVEAATLDNPDALFIRDFSFRIHGLGPSSTPFAYSPRLLPWLRTHAGEYDAIVVNGLWQYHSYAVREACTRTGVPYVVYPHGMLDPYFKRAYPLKHLKKWLYWPWGDYRVLRDAAAVCFTSERECRGARESFWLYSAKEAVVNLGIAPPARDPVRQRSAFYARYPELEGKQLTVFLGRIHPKKGCDLVIKAFAEVLAVDAGWHLVMAGPDQVGWKAALEKLAKDLRVADRITWTGMLSGEDKWGALAAAECFFLPSHQENFGVVVAEALAGGVPVLISDKVDIWREVSEAGAGLVETDTVDGAIALLRRWRAMTPEQKQRMREKAAACFAERFEIGQAAANLIHIVESAASKGTVELYANG